MRAKSGYALRVGRLLLSHPVEGVDRIRGRAELAADRLRPRESEVVTADHAWERRLHEASRRLGRARRHKSVEARWGELARRLDGPLPLGAGHDSDPALARALWCVIRHSRPRQVVETGVARGVLTSFILQALAVNGEGHLWSIDLPPVLPQWHEASAAAVSDDLRGRWTLVRGASRRRLPGLLQSLSGIDVFIHDSLHTQRNMRFELALGWAALRNGGILVSDDVDENTAFVDFCRAHDVQSVVAQEELKPGKFGVVFKPS